jgi:RNA polymerase sigma factor (sigma-70 family)
VPPANAPMAPMSGGAGRARSATLTITPSEDRRAKWPLGVFLPLAQPFLAVPITHLSYSAVCNQRPYQPVVENREYRMDLLERFAAGDLDAFEVLFRQHQRQVYAWIVRIVRDSGIAEDLTVETFWRIYRYRARFDPAGNFGAWAYRIGTNAALDHLRKARHETELPPDLAADPSPDPAIGRETGERIRIAFGRLPARYRLVATLALIENEPHEKIAVAAGISTSLVKVRLFRAVRMLRKQLTAMGLQTGANR